MKIFRQLTHNFKEIQLLVISLCYFLFFSEIFIYPGIINNYFGLDIKKLFLILPALMIVLKIISNFINLDEQHMTRPLVKKFWTLHDLATVIALFLAIIMTGVEYFTYRNFVFSQIGIHFTYFSYLALLMVTLSLLRKQFDYFIRNWKKLILFSPAPLILVAFLIYIIHPDIFRWMVNEDSLVEWLQFFLLIISSYCSYLLAKYWWHHERLLGLLFAACVLVLLFVAGEEISWGQRLLGVSTPEALKEINLQDEVTIHNIGPFFGLVYRGYMLIGLIGSTAWMIKRAVINKLKPRLKTIAEEIIPNWYYFWFFAITFIKNFDRIYISQPVGEVLWEEPMELLLIFGITMFFIERSYRAKKHSKA